MVTSTITSSYSKWVLQLYTPVIYVISFYKVSNVNSILLLVFFLLILD